MKLAIKIFLLKLEKKLGLIRNDRISVIKRYWKKSLQNSTKCSIISKKTVNK